MLNECIEPLNDRILRKHRRAVIRAIAGIDIAVIGVYVARKVETGEDLFLAGRSLTWGMIGFSLFALNISSTTLIGLSLVECVRSGTPQDLRDGGEYGPVPGEMAHAVVSRELRRSRRTGSPLSLLALKGMTALDPAERRALGDSLRAHGREFDTVFAASTDELVILCVNTTRSGAREYVERMRSRARVPDFAVACFPDDAVTVQGLFDAVREPAEGRAPRPVAAVGQIDPEPRRDPEAIS